MRELNDPRDNGPRIGSPPWIYLTAVTGAGGAVLAVALIALRNAGLPVLALLVLLFLLPLAAVDARAAMSRKREHQALHDELPGLPNRAFLDAKTRAAVAEAARI